MADSAQSLIDPYGFQRPPDFDATVHEDFMSHYLTILAHRASRWSGYMKGKKNISKSQKLRRFVRKGIPLQHRPMVWMHISGAEKRRRAAPKLYRQLLEEQHAEELVDSIKIDVPRTFPDNVHFQSSSSDHTVRHRALFNVLIATAHRNKHVGYCQGMNFIAGLLLIVVKDEESVFWLLDTLLNTILPDFYTHDMMGLQTECEVLGELVRVRYPTIDRLVKHYSCPWTLIATRWFICLYIDVIPTETVLRIWDCLFYEGSKILLRVGLTLIHKHSDAILRCQSLPEVIQVFHKQSFAPSVVNCHQFMESTFIDIGPLPRLMIRKMRAECRQKLETDATKPHSDLHKTTAS